MQLPVARQGDPVQGVDTHTVVLPNGASSPMPLPFAGTLNGGLSDNVKIDGRFAATVGSTVDNTQKHLTTIPPGASLAMPATDSGSVARGSSSVRVNGRFLARSTDPVTTCDELRAGPTGLITGGSSTVVAS